MNIRVVLQYELMIHRLRKIPLEYLVRVENIRRILALMLRVIISQPIFEFRKIGCATIAGIGMAASSREPGFPTLVDLCWLLPLNPGFYPGYSGELMAGDVPLEQLHFRMGRGRRFLGSFLESRR